MKKITILKHQTDKRLVKLRTDRATRYQEQSVLISGKKLASELPLKALFVVGESNLQAEEVFQVTDEIMKKITGLKNPEGVAAEVKMPSRATLDQVSRLLVLDGINDPGNMGTLIRTALALGWDGVFLLETSCDPFNDKALRASKGAVFRLPIQWGNWQELKKIVDKNDLQLLVADIEGENYRTVKGGDGLALILGNEAQGPSQESLANSKKITIPMSGQMESLNVSVAGGILLESFR